MPLSYMNAEVLLTQLVHACVVSRSEPLMLVNNIFCLNSKTPDSLCSSYTCVASCCSNNGNAGCKSSSIILKLKHVCIHKQ